jgi:hypothetical protein
MSNEQQNGDIIILRPSVHADCNQENKVERTKIDGWRAPSCAAWTNKSELVFKNHYKMEASRIRNRVRVIFRHLRKNAIVDNCEYSDHEMTFSRGGICLWI